MVEGTRFAKVITCLALITAAWPSFAVHWRWRYRTLRTPHFEIIFNEEQRPLAKRYALAAERAHELVFPIFNEGPARTILVLQDDTDDANGEANFLPYPHIRVYPVLPIADGGLGDYGDAALELMVHEYTHILNMNPAHGFYRPLKYVFGTITRPNAVLPKWYLEGLAVDLESALTTHGRLRAVETRAAARALSLNDGFAKENIARMNEQQILTWPYGSRPYLYGGWWWETAVQHGRGTELIGTLNQDYARRLPFLIEGPLLKRTEKTAETLNDDTHDRLKQRAERELKQIRDAATPTPRAVIDENGEQSVFAISPSGRRLVYWLTAPGLPATAYLRTRTGADEDFSSLKSEVLFRARGTVQARWLDEDHLLFDQIDVTRPYVSYRDLYLYDVNTRERRALTTGFRAQEASPSPSGRRVVFIRNTGGQNAIYILDVAGGAPRRLLGGGLSQRLSGPEFLSEDEIAFSLRTVDGREVLKRFDLRTRRVSDFQSQLRLAQHLRRVNGGWLVSDAGTGVRNVYSIRNGQATVAVTNTLTDAARADYDPARKEILVSELRPEGRRLVALPFAPQTPKTVDVERLPPPPPVPTVKVKVEEGGYHPAKYLLPRYWIPALYQVENGVLLQGQTSVADPVGRNAYDLIGYYDTVTRRGSYAVDYLNTSLPSQIGLGYGKVQTYLGASGVLLQSQNAYLRFTQNWPFNTRQASWSLGGVWLDSTSTVASYRRIGPQVSFRASNFDSPLGAWHGVQFEASHAQYLNEPNYYAYGRTALHLAQTARLGRGHHVSLQARGVFSPGLPLARVVVLGERNVGGNYLVNLANSTLMMRGYPSGNFVAKKVVNANLEYAFPLIPVDRGFGTRPLYIKNLEVALFTDLMGLEGGAFRRDLLGYERTSLGHYYVGAGTEFRFGTTVAYHVPLTVTLGLYYGADQAHGGGLSPFLGFQLGGLTGLKGETP